MNMASLPVNRQRENRTETHRADVRLSINDAISSPVSSQPKYTKVKFISKSKPSKQCSASSDNSEDEGILQMETQKKSSSSSSRSVKQARVSRGTNSSLSPSLFCESLLNSSSSMREKDVMAADNNCRTPKKQHTFEKSSNDEKDQQQIVANASASQTANLRRRRRRRKKIHWNKSVRVQVIHNLRNYSSQEKKNTWHSPDDYTRMEEECELTSMHMDQLESEPLQDGMNKFLPTGLCNRGLESWTIRGEESKETRVQLVIDTVWQAQIDAWELLSGNQSSSSTSLSSSSTRSKSNSSTRSKSKTAAERKKDKMYLDCWDFIKRRCVKASASSSRLAREIAVQDEKDILPYMKSVRALEESRQRLQVMLEAKYGNHLEANFGKYGSNDTAVGPIRSILKRSTPIGQTYTEPDAVKRVKPSKTTVSESSLDTKRDLKRKPNVRADVNPRCPSRFLSPVAADPSGKTMLRDEETDQHDDNDLDADLFKLFESIPIIAAPHGSVDSDDITISSPDPPGKRKGSMDDKKIHFKPKSKTKIPTSPVGSVCSNMNDTISDEGSLNRMMRSHMSLSVTSDESTRRRMLRSMKNL